MRLSQQSAYFKVSLLATILVFCVILLGAYTRLKDAGLGCPDWPGCFGQITVPQTKAEIMHAVKLYPTQPVQPTKAWPEMVHRYFAGILGLMVFALAIWAPIRKVRVPDQPLAVPLILAGLVILQALSGMWTVTWQLLPLIVMGHLLGGMTIFALLWWLTLKTGYLFTKPVTPFITLRFWSVVALIIVAIQIFLGGWTTANYASLVCTTFPDCHGTLFPTLEVQRAFNFLSPIGTNYQGGVLDANARITIQMAHRYWGVITIVYLAILAIFLITSRSIKSLKNVGWMLLLLVILQMFLGYLNIKLLLPMEVALAHNAVAALLLATVVTLIYKLFSIHTSRGVI